MGFVRGNNHISYSKEPEIKELANSPEHDVLYMGLKDRFGDSGIVGVAIMYYSDTSAVIDSFLLSCRVIGRGLEDVLLKECLELSRKRRHREIRGIYIKTNKNNQVADFYPKRGFKIIEQTDSCIQWKFLLKNPSPEIPGYFKKIDVKT